MSEWHHTRTGGLNPDEMRLKLERAGFRDVQVRFRITTNPELGRGDVRVAPHADRRAQPRRDAVEAGAGGLPRRASPVPDHDEPGAGTRRCPSGTTRGPAGSTPTRCG